MNAIIYTPQNNAQRVKFYIPYQASTWRTQIKQLDSTFYHPNQKLWSIVNTKENMNALDQIFGKKCTRQKVNAKPQIPQQKLKEKSLVELEAYEQKLILKAYSPNTLAIYRSNFIRFLTFFENRKLDALQKSEIESYVAHLISKFKISNSAQNQLINAIKFYYEHVLDKPREYYNIQRPKKAKTLPNILSEQEVILLLQAPDNIKHKAILTLIYSAGLRISEITNLRITDINSADMNLFVKAAKGKKDRITILSKHMLDILRLYYKKHKPSYWLFEGQNGDQYSTSSINKVFRKAALKARINAWATPHTLRHSFATHLLQQGVNLRYIQALLGHGSSKTTEIYTHVMNINNKTVVSPLDKIWQKTNLEG